jgi:putative phage-type endonuclease
MEIQRVTGWHEWRARGVGASEVAGVLGISPWASPYSVWQAKVGGGDSGTSGNVEAMRWGQLLEQAILTECERRLGFSVYGQQTWCTHREHEWALCTVDAFYSDGTDHDPHGVIEVKTTSDPRWYDVPDHYAVQVQWQLEVTDMQHAWLACLHNGRRLSLWSVDRDRELGADLLAVVGDFWARHVLGGEPPPVDGTTATTAAIARRFATTEPELVADLSALAPQIDRLRELRELGKAVDSERVEIENAVKEALGPAEAGDVDGQRAVTWKTATSRRVDLDRLRDEHPDIAAECSTETTTRRFLLKASKP